MKTGLKPLIKLIGIASLTGCATASLDVKVDVFEKDPSVDLPLSDRKVEAMLQNLAQIRESAGHTVATKNELATTTFALYNDALSLLVENRALNMKNRYQPIVSCADTTETDTHSDNAPSNNTAGDISADDESANEAKQTSMHVQRQVGMMGEDDEQGNYNSTPPANASDSDPIVAKSAVEKYSGCLDKRYTKFKETLDNAEKTLLHYLKVYKAAYLFAVQQQCKKLPVEKKNSTKDDTQTFRLTACEEQYLPPEYFEKELRVLTTFNHSKEKARKQERREEWVKHTYLFDRTTLISQFRQYYVKTLPNGTTSKDSLNTYNSYNTNNYFYTVESSDTSKAALSEITVPDNENQLICRKDDSNCTPFANLEVDTLNQVSKVIADYKAINLPTMYLNWVNVEHLINAQITSHKLANNTEQQVLWQNFAKQLQRKLVTVYSASGLSPKTATRTLARAFDDTSFQAANLAIANELEALRNDLPDSASSRTALESLVKNKSTLNDLVDRLQNAGDPVWRVITNPVFENQWNMINQQSFKGDGNTSVVVIRDTPTRFRTSQAKNDPTVLANNQIVISSAIAEATINAVGSAAGLGELTTTQKEDTGAVTLNTNNNDVVAAQIDFQKKVIANLRNELSSLLSEIEAQPSELEPDAVNKLKASASARIQAYLSTLTLMGAQDE